VENYPPLSSESWVPSSTARAAIFEWFFVHLYKHFFVKMADKGNDSAEEEDPTIAEDVVVTKYKMAGDMANRK